MNQKGVLQLEATICFAAFLAALALFLSILGQSGLEAEYAVGRLGEKAKAEKCCVFVDSAFASGISYFSGNVPCEAEGGKAKVSGKKSDCLAKDMRLVERGGKTVLEIGLNERYR